MKLPLQFKQFYCPFLFEELGLDSTQKYCARTDFWAIYCFEESKFTLFSAIFTPGVYYT